MVQISGSGGNQFEDADQVVGDDVEEEVAGDLGDLGDLGETAMLGTSQGATLLALAEHAFEEFAVGCDMM